MQEEVDKGAASLGSDRLAAPPPLLPDEMVFEFLLRLPIKSLHKCNCVSKGWRSLISSPGFIQAYKARHPDVGLLAVVPEPSVLPRINSFYFSTLRIREPGEFVSRFHVPCPDFRCDQITEVINGLVCFYNRDGLFLCNIFTREVMPLPDSNRARKYFLGFDVVNGVYKLLGLSSCSTEILTLGRGSDCCWRMISGDSEHGCIRTFLISQRNSSFCVSGVLHWMVLRHKSRGKTRCCLVSFDLNKEEFRRVKVPRGLTSTCLFAHCFVKFRENFALSVPTYTGGYRLSLHILEDDEGNSWTKHSIALPEELNKGRGLLTIPAGNLPDGQMLLVNPAVEELPTPVYSYDPQTFKLERFLVGKLMMGFALNISCMEENLTAFDDLFSGVKGT